MKNHLILLFDAAHRWRTIIFFIIAAALIYGSRMLGTTDNPIVVGLLMTGMVFVFLTLIHPWEQSKSYTTLMMLCLGLILFIFLLIFVLSELNKSLYVNDGLVTGLIGLVCIPGIVAGLIGNIFLTTKLSYFG